ncbi:hypothetical protein [Streptomyces chiangmaiensis]|uniref:Uncharacterized protein n=1 Tax=Streptomyces chiangmaiensis TaxID=766497 RepID=A0ABU7FH72_9ACTN|nr:hypothetical protein [Streptomyces chiangmaiensis]MED7822967.1 hypothetical protein [Streptomyces chiangmaiensis]
MTKYTIDDVYGKLASVEYAVDALPKSGSSQAVTATELDKKVASLKKAIEEGPKDKPTDLKGALAELPVLKEILGVLKAGGGIATTVLILVAVKATLSSIGVKIFDLQKAVQALSRAAFSGRELTTTENGRITLAAPEQPQQPHPLPSVTQVNEVKEAIRKLNEEVHTYSTRARELPSSREMRQLASAGERLDRVARSHRNIDQLAQSTHTLTQRFTALSQAVAGASGGS